VHIVAESVTVRQTVYVPDVVYVCVAMNPLPVVASPKSQVYVQPKFKGAAVNVCCPARTELFVQVALQLGGAIATVTELQTVSVQIPPASEIITQTLYVPAEAY
jgi:hypothetical protein